MKTIEIKSCEPWDWYSGLGCPFHKKQPTLKETLYYCTHGKMSVYIGWDENRSRAIPPICPLREST